MELKIQVRTGIFARSGLNIDTMKGAWGCLFLFSKSTERKVVAAVSRSSEFNASMDFSGDILVVATANKSSDIDDRRSRSEPIGAWTAFENRRWGLGLLEVRGNSVTAGGVGGESRRMHLDVELEGASVTAGLGSEICHRPGGGVRTLGVRERKVR